MFDQQMRRVKERAFHPFARFFSRFSPATLTLVALLLGVATAVLLAYQLYWLALVGWFLNRAFDALDGVVARLRGLESDFGGYLDIVADFLIYALIPMGLVWGRPSTAGLWLLAALLAAFYANAASWMYLAAILEKRDAGAAAQNEQTTITMPAGLIGGTETILFFSLFILLPAWYPWLFGLMVALLAVTVGQRLVWAYGRLR